MIDSFPFPVESSGQYTLTAVGYSHRIYDEIDCLDDGASGHLIIGGMKSRHAREIVSGVASPEQDYLRIPSLDYHDRQRSS